ncbi:hypothetical protein C1645_823045 [Glomus cerebriforme]|uniref:Uncharacterized protein n=1 Tax=Glomus cerebriforme TaxID=658196 RepID=A0A397T6C9_9GLOM|nr:hypothetical protein C1645_823045 [Glomus cerebriforme]
MAFLNKICKNKIGIQKSSINKKEKSKKSSKLSQLSQLSLRIIISKPKNIHKRRKIQHNTKLYERRKSYSKDDLITVIPSQENIKARSRSHSISYNSTSTFNSTLTPDKKTWRPVKNINIKANVFWGEEYKKEQINLSISRTNSYNSFKNILSKKLGYEIPNDFAILYHTRRKHLLLWRDDIEITIVKKSIIY